MDAVNLVEAGRISVLSERPDQNDVFGERAAIVRCRRDEDRMHTPTANRHQSELLDPRRRIPGGPVHDLRVVAKRSGRCSEHEMLVRRATRADNPTAPRLRAAPHSGRADDVEHTRGRPVPTCLRQVLRHLRRAWNRVRARPSEHRRTARFRRLRTPRARVPELRLRVDPRRPLHERPW